MSFDMNNSHSSDDDPQQDEVNSLKTLSDSSFANGTGVSLNQMRLAQALTKENIGWILILALAGEVFGITDKALILLGGVC
jgi:hypothetical protein